MYRSRIAWLACASRLMVSSVRGQDSGWMENQVSATLCAWDYIRVTTIRDIVYLDGGAQEWLAGMVDGSINTLPSDDNPLGLIWTLNFSTPFGASTNFSSILNNISKAPNGGAANNFAPNYYDGALLGNDHEFYLFGGLLQATDLYSAPDGETVEGYIESQYGTHRDGFHQGFLNMPLGNGMTPYVTYGAAASAPSENKAWYFGGYRSPSWGPIYQYTNSTYDPSTISNTFITLDMSTQTSEVWTNTTLPSGIPSRANPSMVWVPVGEQGILVVLGGVTYPEYENTTRISSNETQSRKDSPAFMSNIDIYDIAGDKWYQQPTVGSPPQLTKGCAVVGTASDRSSFNIYYYGGYDGLDSSADFSDDVWILSLPTFMWMKVSSGKADHARAGHQCVMPYPDQMVAIGGRTSTTGGKSHCLGGGDSDNPGIAQVYNLTAVTWMDSYDPDNWNDYGVPEMIHMMIGGDYSGGATLTTPTPSGWATSDLGEVFATPYPTSKITTYYPYSSMGPGNGTREDLDGGGKKGTPSWVGAVIGVVLGLAFITAGVVAILLYRKRKLLKKSDGSNPSSSSKYNQVNTWIRGLPKSTGKAPTINTDDTHTQIDDIESRGVTPGQPEMRLVPPTEMPDTPLVELWDTSFSPRPELVGDPGTKNTGFSHIMDLKQSPTNPSIYSGPPPYTQRPDSPPLGHPTINTNIAAIANGPTPPPPVATPNRNAVVSGVSGISDRDAGHLRQISDTTVSSQGTGNNNNNNNPSTIPEHGSVPSDPSPPLPVSPPSVFSGVDEAPDYVSAHHQQQPSSSLASRIDGGAEAGNPSRHSMFVEHEDDLGEHGKELR
ncbi:hypothetical protein M426DRAFT_75990 [Hypoxylon sp. CI-4A]|nr:hypothetical protein M426DRAFT_75990 [Hypoxylon sp. CI-4A]